MDKLKEKKQNVYNQRQAAQTVSIYYDLLSAGNQRQQSTTSEKHGENRPWTKVRQKDLEVSEGIPPGRISVAEAAQKNFSISWGELKIILTFWMSEFIEKLQKDQLTTKKSFIASAWNQGFLLGGQAEGFSVSGNSF